MLEGRLGFSIPFLGVPCWGLVSAGLLFVVDREFSFACGAVRWFSFASVPVRGFSTVFWFRLLGFCELLDGGFQAGCARRCVLSLGVLLLLWFSFQHQSVCWFIGFVQFFLC